MKNICSKCGQPNSMPPQESGRGKHALTVDNGVLAGFGHKIRLSPILFRLFHLLYRYPSKTISHDFIMHSLYQERLDQPFRSAVKMHIMKLRRKLAPINIKIKSDWGYGYRLELPKQPEKSKNRLND